MALKPKDVWVQLPVQLILDCHWLVYVRGEGLTDRSIDKHYLKHQLLSKAGISIATIDINVYIRTINFNPSIYVINMSDCKTEIILCGWELVCEWFSMGNDLMWNFVHCIYILGCLHHQYGVYWISLNFNSHAVPLRVQDVTVLIDELQCGSV